MNELILCESLTLRKELCTDKNTSVLEKVGQLVYWPNTQYTTIKNVAQFYQVTIKAVENNVQRHFQEFQEDGYKVLSKRDLENPQLEGFEIPNRGVALFPRRAILRMGMLLRDSLVAQKVRSYLLNIEELSTKIPISYENLNEMANQLTVQAIELGNHAVQLTQHAERLNANNEQLQANASQLTKNAEQMIFQSKLIKIMVEEMFENKHELRKLKSNFGEYDSRLNQNDKRIEALEEVVKNLDEKSAQKLSEEQLELLKKRVKLKNLGMKGWADFKKHFQISRYRDLPKQKFREALDWLENYES